LRMARPHFARAYSKAIEKNQQTKRRRREIIFLAKRAS
jgi:hypothetical protein